MTSFINIPIEIDAEQLEQSVYEALGERFPGWEPNPGNLETWLVKALVPIGVGLAEAAVDVPGMAFAGFGEKVAGVPPLGASAAAGLTTWTMVDNQGYTIPAGTLVGIEAAGDEVIGFEVTTEVGVPPGSLATADGEVQIHAVQEGEHANLLTEDPTLIDALDFVASIALVAPTSGGADAESTEDYLNRLAAEFQLLTRRPILPRDVEVMARRVAGVARAVALDGYNPADQTSNNERMLSVAIVDEAGQALSTAIKNEVDALLEAERELTFIFHVIDPIYTAVDVDVEITTFPGFDPVGMAAIVEQAISDYLSPATWGRSPFDDDEATWRNVTVVRRNELIALVDRVEGVDRVVDVQLAEAGSPVGVADVALDEPAPLAEPGAIAVTVS